jgi:hypothetical protein
MRVALGRGGEYMAEYTEDASEEILTFERVGNREKQK